MARSCSHCGAPDLTGTEPTLTATPGAANERRPPPNPLNGRWFILRDEQVVGPYTGFELRDLVASDKLSTSDLVCAENTEQWHSMKADRVLAGVIRDARPSLIRLGTLPTSKFIYRTVAIVLVCALGWTAWPYFTAYRLARSIHQGDADALQNMVDWLSLKEGLRADLNSRFITHIGKQGSGGPMAAGLAAALGPAIINGMIDAYVTPEAITRLVQTGKLERERRIASGSVEGATKSTTDIIRSVKSAFFSGSPFVFRVELQPPDSSESQTASLVFHWSGSWKLSRLSLPFDFNLADKSARSDPLEKSATPGAPNKDTLANRPNTTDRAGQPSNLPAVPVAQRVVLYDEDPSEPQGRQYVGQVTWRTENVAERNGTSDIAIRADIDIPERKFKAALTIRRNLDASLPASHTVEITFQLPPDFVGGGISNVPGALMKSNEQSRGTPLAGLAVKVTDNIYLIGLSNVDADRDRNLQLLKERSWFDIPLVYANQRRAIIALEKGVLGELAFKNAFTAWEAARQSVRPGGG